MCCNNTHQGAPRASKQTCACASDLGDASLNNSFMNLLYEFPIMEALAWLMYAWFRKWRGWIMANTSLQGGLRSNQSGGARATKPLKLTKLWCLVTRFSCPTSIFTVFVVLQGDTRITIQTCIGFCSVPESKICWYASPCTYLWMRHHFKAKMACFSLREWEWGLTFSRIRTKIISWTKITLCSAEF